MFNLLSSELFRMKKRAQSWILLVITIVLTGLIYGGFTIAARMQDGPDGPSMRETVTFVDFSEFVLTMSIGFFGSIMLVIVAAGAMGNEFSWNTLRPLVARARSRASLLTAKLSAIVVYSVIFVLSLLVVLTGMVFIGSWIVGEPSGFSWNIMGWAVSDAMLLLLSNAPAMALAFLLATAFRSNAAGIAGALGLTFVEEPIFALLGLASDVFNDIKEWGISFNTTNVAQLSGDPIELRSVVITLAYTALFLAISFWIFLRRDVTSG